MFAAIVCHDLPIVLSLTVSGAHCPKSGGHHVTVKLKQAVSSYVIPVFRATCTARKHSPFQPNLLQLLQSWLGHVGDTTCEQEGQAKGRISSQHKATCDYVKSSGMPRLTDKAMILSMIHSLFRINLCDLQRVPDCSHDGFSYKPLDR